MKVLDKIKTVFASKPIAKPVYRLFAGGRKSYMFDTSLNLRTYEQIYKTDSITFSTINTLAYSTVYCGHQILGDTNDVIRKFYKKVRINEILVQAITSCLIYGDAYIEKVFGRGAARNNLLDLVVRDPKNIYSERDEYGNVVRYVQTLSGGKKNYIDPSYLIHLRFYGLPTDSRGISLVGANIELIRRRSISDEAIATAIERHGTPRYQVVLHPTEDNGVKTYPDENVLSTVEDKFEDMSAKHEFVTIDLIDIKPLDVRGVNGVEDYYNYFTSLQAAGFSVPLEMLGFSGSSTEASSRTRLLMFERHIKSYQRIIENILNNEVHPYIKGANPDAEFVFGDVSPTDEFERIRAIEPLINTDGGPFGLLTKGEIRFRAGFPATQMNLKRSKKDENEDLST